MSNVRRLLVTGDDSQLMQFHLPVCMALNPVNRRGRSVLYTCMAHDLPAALDVARDVGVTVQQIHGAGDHETYSYLVGAEGSGWSPDEDDEDDEDDEEDSTCSS